MKKVIETREVAHVWANQLQDEARNSGNNFYFRGNTIYSYGSHFPIAVHYNGVVLFTLRGYSNTTAKHISYTRSAVSHKDLVYCDNPQDSANGFHDGSINHWMEQIELNLQALQKAKKPEKYLSEIDRIKSEMKVYTDLFGVTLSDTQTKILNISDKSQYAELLKTRAEAIAAQEKKEIAARKRMLKDGQKLYGEYRSAYWNYQETEFKKNLTRYQRQALDQYHYSLNYHTLLRTDGETVETSKGMKMPVQVAKRYFSFYQRIVNNGGCDGNCNYKMLDYEVTKASEFGLVIGCHSIPASEITHLAEQLKWELKQETAS